METKEVKTMEIKKAVEKINSLINPVSFAVKAVGTDNIIAIFRYRYSAEKWRIDHILKGGLEVVRIDLSGCDLLLNTK